MLIATTVTQQVRAAQTWNLASKLQEQAQPTEASPLFSRDSVAMAQVTVAKFWPGHQYCLIVAFPPQLQSAKVPLSNKAPLLEGL